MNAESTVRVYHNSEQFPVVQLRLLSDRSTLSMEIKVLSDCSTDPQRPQFVEPTPQVFDTFENRLKIRRETNHPAAATITNAVIVCQSHIIMPRSSSPRFDTSKTLLRTPALSYRRS